MTPKHATIGLACTLALLSGGAVSAQDQPDMAAPAGQPTAPARPATGGPEPGGLYFSVGGGGAYVFDTDIDRGGEFNLTHAYGEVSVRSIVTDDFQVAFSFRYLWEDYDFSGDEGIGGLDPWDDIHTQEVGVILTYDLTNDWSIFGGPVANFSRESGAAFDESDVYGGFVGVQYAPEPDFRIGFGFGLIDQLEDESVRFFPTIIFDWKLSPEWSIESSTTSLGSGLDLVYTYSRGFQAAVGGGYLYRRFRLDDEDIVPDGVGEVSAANIRGRLTFRPDPRFRIDVTAGVLVFGEIRVEDERGSSIRHEDFDPGFHAGISFEIRF